MKLDMIGLVVKDMNLAIEFYEHLGLSVSQSFGDDYKELSNDGIRISLNTRKMISGIYGYEPKSVGDIIELAFLMDSVNAVDELCAKMDRLGYEIFKSPWDADWGQRYAIIRDVDGNLISLFAAL